MITPSRLRESTYWDGGNTASRTTPRSSKARNSKPRPSVAKPLPSGQAQTVVLPLGVLERDLVVAGGQEALVA